eukprot:1372709-Amorphochlora_amoeboformis.AAC.1
MRRERNGERKRERNRGKASGITARAQHARRDISVYELGEWPASTYSIGNVNNPIAMLIPDLPRNPKKNTCSESRDFI